MTQLNFTHKEDITPPPRLLPVVEKTKDTYKNWITIHRNIPRTERFGIGLKIDSLFLELLEILRTATYAQIMEKIKILENGLLKIDSLRFFVQILWETRLISNSQFITLGGDIENIGKMVGGWKKGIIIKTSANKAEERI